MPIKKIYIFLFFTGLFFLGFNEYEGIPILGEFQKEVAALFFIPAFLFLLLSKKVSIPLKNPVMLLLVAFLGTCVLSTLVNLPTIFTNYFKFTSGINRSIRQYISLFISAVAFFILYWNVFTHFTVSELLLRMRKVIWWSLLCCSVYGFFEIATVVFGISPFRYVLDGINYLPFLEVAYHLNARISSFALEPPFLAIYLTTIAGWMFSYILTEDKWTKFVPTVLILILTYFSGSRTALIIIFIQLAIFLFILYRDKRYRKYIAYLTVFLIFASVLLLTINAKKVVESVEKKVESLQFSDNLKRDISNKSRLGIQYATLQVFLDHPVIGVGFGQSPYHSRFYYPNWATHKNWEFEYLYKNQKERSFPPGYNLYVRMLAETGIVGISIFLFLMYTTLRLSYNYMKNKDNNVRILAIILFISFAGLIINWMQIDTFRIYGFWISLALLIKLSQTIATQKNEQDSSTDTPL